MPMNGGSPSPHSVDSNSNAPSSTHALANSRNLLLDGQITPSISLIPIKQVSFDRIDFIKIAYANYNTVIFVFFFSAQEPSPDDYESPMKSVRSQSVSDQMSNSMYSTDNVSTNASESNVPSSSNLTSLIKVRKQKAKIVAIFFCDQNFNLKMFRFR